MTIQEVLSEFPQRSTVKDCGPGIGRAVEITLTDEVYILIVPEGSVIPHQFHLKNKQVDIKRKLDIKDIYSFIYLFRG